VETYLDKKSDLINEYTNYQILFSRLDHELAILYELSKTDIDLTDHILLLNDRFIIKSDFLTNLQEISNNIKSNLTYQQTDAEIVLQLGSFILRHYNFALCLDKYNYYNSEHNEHLVIETALVRYRDSKNTDTVISSDSKFKLVDTNSKYKLQSLNFPNYFIGVINDKLVLTNQENKIIVGTNIIDITNQINNILKSMIWYPHSFDTNYQTLEF